MPTSGQLALGELAINYNDGNLFFKNAGGTVQTLVSTQFVSVAGNVTGGNIRTVGTVSATGNVTGNYFIGNGSQLTGITVSAGASIVNGTSNVTVSASSNITANVAGSAIATWASTGEYVTGLISATGNIVSSGNVSGTYILGNGALLTGVITSVANINLGTSNVTVVSSGGNVTVGVGGTSNVVVWATTGEYVTGLISATGNVIGGNINTGAQVSATGNITGGNIITAAAMSAASVSASGNVTGGNLNAAGLSLSSNVVSALNASSSIAAGTTISAVGNITGGNLITAAAVSAASVSASGNVTGGNINGTTAVVVPTVRNTAALTISTSSGDLNLQPTGNIVVNSKYINGVTDPVQDQDVATKKYVDNFATTGISYHQPVAAASTTTMATTTGGTITYTQPNGAGNGVGALLTTTGAFNLIDTANVQTVGTRILVKNEANAVYNGVYTWANATNIVRSTDTDEYGADSTVALSINDYFFTTGGNVNAGAAFIVSAPAGTITFGTSSITFSTFSTSQVYTANTAAGISLAGTVINAKVDGTTTAFDGSGNISVKASATLTTPNIGAATGTSLSTTGNVTGGNILGTTTVYSGGVQVLTINDTVDGGTY